ncbi:uncharacterized protein LOC106665527 isoform X2 [Cimex lectularius]|uniref:Uncharacterized protein n=1 Tax=Cimex lectularius TaxID=79782 RepID=A0A8I6RL67_CIMLE|nr:uncharacterized protein LOC106665527 isoform X2 [Cimex lectularius]
MAKILSTNTFCQKLKQAMTYASKKLYNKEIKLKLAEDVESICLSPQPDTFVDYVAVVVDTTMPNGSEFCKEKLRLLEPNYLSTRICLVNGSCSTGPLPVAKKLVKLADEYNIPFINGEIMDNNSCKLTGERILKMAVISTGFQTGIPVLIPTPKDLELIS